eukprot:jgi/Ulvmu1/5718/UM024_0070.1
MLARSQAKSTALLARLATGQCWPLLQSQFATDQETVDFGFKDVPKADKESLVKKVFENVAPQYDVMNDVMSGGLHRVWKDHFVSKLCPPPGIQHLDVAGGTGDIAFRVLNEMRASGSLTGAVSVLDINEAMLTEGQKRADKKGLSGPGLRWVTGSAEELPFDSDTFDSYTVAFGIRNVTDRAAALAEAYRVLKRGGRFMCLEFSPVDTPVLKDVYDAYSMNVIPAMGKVIANDSESYRYLVESIRKFPDVVTFAEQVQNAGFRFVDFDKLSGGIVAIHSGFKL